MAVGSGRLLHIFNVVLGMMILAVMVLAGSMAGAGDKWGIFVDGPSAIWVGGIVVGGLWMSFGPLMVLRALRAVILPDPMPVREAYAIYVLVFTRGRGLAWAAGLLGTLIGIMITLQNMDDPSSIGAGAAVSLIALLYGALTAELIFAALRQVVINTAAKHGLDLPLP